MGYKTQINEKESMLKIYVPYNKILFQEIMKDLSENVLVLLEQAKQKIENKHQLLTSSEEKISTKQTPFQDPLDITLKRE